MRQITTHNTYKGDRQPIITALGKVGSGGAEQVYRVVYPCPPKGAPCVLTLEFVTQEQFGVTNEALLAVVIDRLEGFQSGKFACVDNVLALTNCREALMRLQDRTKERISRGVEGKPEK